MRVGPIILTLLLSLWAVSTIPLSGATTTPPSCDPSTGDCGGVTLQAVNQNDQTIAGLTVLLCWSGTSTFQNGSNDCQDHGAGFISSGGTPATFGGLPNDQAFDAFVENNESCAFQHWSDSPSDTSQLTGFETANPPVVLTAVYYCYATSQLTVVTQDTYGNPLQGYGASLNQSGAIVIPSVYTPASFHLDDGLTYAVHVGIGLDGYGNCQFDYWLDTGSTNATRSISITNDTEIIAVMDCPAVTTASMTQSSTTTSSTSSTASMYSSSGSSSNTDTSSSSSTSTVSSSLTQNTSSYASATNSSLGISLVLQLSTSGTSGDNVTVRLTEVNLLNSTNTVPYGDNWKFTFGGLADSDYSAFPSSIAFGIFRGNLNLSDYQAATPLVLYNSATEVPSCTQSIAPTAFDPLANESVAQSTGGYWTGGYYTSTPAVFVPFPAGNYTVIGVDEWGKILLLHFDVQDVASTSSSSSSESSQPITTSSSSTATTNSTTQSNMSALSAGFLAPVAMVALVLAAMAIPHRRRRNERISLNRM